MKLLRYGLPREERPGCLDADGNIRDLAAAVADIDPNVISPEGLRRLRSIPLDGLPVIPVGTRLGPPIAGIGKLVLIGLNYRDHAVEAGLPIPTEPVVLLKATSAISGPNDPIIIPPGAEKVDWEVELAIVIGQRARHVRRNDALAHVAGYTIVNDVSERAYQLERGGTWDKGKSYDSFAPVGPWLVTLDEVVDPHSLSIWTEVNDVRRQDGSTANMVFDVATIVSYVSAFMTLMPGDIIATGTPAGVALGQKPEQTYLKAGDVVRLGIDGLGVQEQVCVPAPATVS